MDGTGTETTPMITRSILTRALSCSAALAMALSTGCFGHNPGGNMSSNDFFTYESTPHMPLSVTLVDTRDGSELWSVDVPVGQKLAMGFHEERSRQADIDTPDLMRWEIYSASLRSNSLRNAMAVPPSEARRLELVVREGPEYPVAPAPSVRVEPVATSHGGLPLPHVYSASSSLGRQGTYVADEHEYMDGNDPARSVVIPGNLNERDGSFYSSVTDED